LIKEKDQVIEVLIKALSAKGTSKDDIASVMSCSTSIVDDVMKKTSREAKKRPFLGQSTSREDAHGE
jgi:transposase